MKNLNQRRIPILFPMAAGRSFPATVPWRAWRDPGVVARHPAQRSGALAEIRRGGRPDRRRSLMRLGAAGGLQGAASRARSLHLPTLGCIYL